MIEIQRIDTSDWQVFRDLRLAALADAPDAFGSQLEAERARGASEWRERLAGRSQFVALADGRPVGTIGARSEGEREMELISMWVAPEVRRVGVAGQLVAAVIEEARVRGSVSVVLWVSEGNLPAERLYEKHSFVRTGRTQPIDDTDASRGTEFEMRRSVRSADRSTSRKEA
jgi:GNAT superfamily N-acetyltransferase